MAKPPPSPQVATTANHTLSPQSPSNNNTISANNKPSTGEALLQDAIQILRRKCADGVAACVVGWGFGFLCSKRLRGRERTLAAEVVKVEARRRSRGEKENGEKEKEKKRVKSEKKKKTITFDFKIN